MSFITELVIKPANHDEWELVEPLDYYCYRYETIIVVPAGFVMDLASIPRLLTPIFPVHGKYTRAAAIHDWLYAQRGFVKNRYFTRKECDIIFEDAMAELGVSWIKRKLMYAAVRLGGWLAWN